MLLEILLGGVMMVMCAGSEKSSGQENESKFEKATFAGGCFWCMEPAFDSLGGIISVRVGYTGGRIKNPSYEEVCTGTTGHAEAIQIVFDPSKVSYRRLLDIFWKNIDPTTKNRQFCDIGTQYRTAVFYHSETQKVEAVSSRQQIADRIQGAIYTEIVPASEFFPAETYHQKFYRKNPNRYHSYHEACGREERLKDLWGK